MKLEDITPKSITKVPDDELTQVHHQTHQWYANAKDEGRSIEPIVHAHNWLAQEMERRGMEHNSPMPGMPKTGATIGEVETIGDVIRQMRGLELVVKSYARHRCMECSEPPTKEILWAEGMGHAWFCDKHLKEFVEKSPGWHDIDSERKLKYGIASNDWKDGPPTSQEAANYYVKHPKVVVAINKAAEDYKLNGIVLVPDYVSIVGSSLKNFKNAHDLDFVIRDTDKVPLYWKENIYLILRKIYDPEKLGKEIHLIFNPQGPHQGTYLPLYDLVLRDNPEDTKIVKSASEMPGWKSFIKDAPDKGIMLDLGPGTAKPNHFIGLGYGNEANIRHDLEKTPWPIKTGSCSIVRANHVLEHLGSPVAIMQEIYRVLAPGGKAIITVPSTDGQGAFAHPEHKSFWNKSSFVFWTDKRYNQTIDGNKDKPALFDLEYLDDRDNGNAVYTDAVLRKPKDGIDGTFDPSKDFETDTHIQKVNPDADSQPRDDLGLWTPTGAAGHGGLSGREWAAALADDEKNAVHTWQRSSWEEIREYQKTGKGSPETKALNDRWQAALNKDGSHVGTVYRGVGDLDKESLDKLVSADTITLRADSSSSMDARQAAGFALSSGMSEPSNGVMYKIDTKTGVDITPASHQAFIDQKEVVLKQGTTYKVTDRTKDKYRLWGKVYTITTLHLKED